MRKARLGLLSVAEMADRRWAARGLSDMRMGSPEGLVRGCRIACAGCESEGEGAVAEVAAASALRGHDGGFAMDLDTSPFTAVGLFGSNRAGGARKSRYSG